MYPGIKRTLQNQISNKMAWTIIEEKIVEAEHSSFNRTKARYHLELAAKDLIDYGYFRDAAKVLYYYDHFYF